MAHKLKLLIVGLFISSLSFGQVTGTNAYMNGFGQPASAPNGTNGQVWTMFGTTQMGWTSGGSSPTGSALFYQKSFLQKSPNNQQDTFLTPQYGGSGYERNQANKFLVGNFYNVVHSQNAGVAAQVKWVFFGDSFSEIIYNSMLVIWQNICGGIYSGVFGQGDGISVTPITSVGVTSVTNRFKAWPTGITNYITNTGTWTLGVGGAASTCNKISICYVKQPNGGTFEWKVTGGSYSSPISTSGTLGQLGIVEIKLPLSTYTLEIQNSTGAKDSDEFALIGFEDTAVNGLTAIHVGTGGLQSDSCTNNITGVTNFQQFLYYEHPTVFTQEWKDDSLYFGATMDTIYHRLSYDTTLKHTDVIGIGSTPVGTTSGANLNQWVQNQQMQDKTLKYGFIYYDTYQFFGINPTQAFNNLQSLNWDSGGVHVNNTCNQYRGGRMLSDLGFYGASEEVMANNVRNASTITSSLGVTTQGTGIINGTIKPYGANDLQIVSNRDNYLMTASGRYNFFGWTGKVAPATNATVSDSGTMYVSGVLTNPGGLTGSSATFSSQVTFNSFATVSSSQYLAFGANWYGLGSGGASTSKFWVMQNHANSVNLGGWDTNGCSIQSIDTAKNGTNSSIATAHRGQNLVLNGTATSVQITEPQGTLQNGDVFDVLTTSSSVSLTWTNSTHFVATPPTTVTNTQAHEFIYLLYLTKWLQKY